MNSLEKSAISLPIAAVERDTGLTKDTLRVWERRYGFPSPDRDPNGERLYPPDQIQRLRLLKRLLDHGKRPARLMRASDDELAEMLDGLKGSDEAPQHLAQRDETLQILRRHAEQDLRASLGQRLLKQGLQSFVVDTVAPLNVAIGEAWLAGEIDVAEEHLYTEQIQNVLRNAIGLHDHGRRAPRVLLTTLPDELHILGILMVEAMLVPEGASCVSLGTQTPVKDICSVAMGGRFDVVALSFSAAYPVRRALGGLDELRAALPPEIEIWCGGAALRGKQQRLPGIHVIEDLQGCVEALRQWRERNAIELR